MWRTQGKIQYSLSNKHPLLLVSHQRIRSEGNFLHRQENMETLMKREFVGIPVGLVAPVAFPVEKSLKRLLPDPACSQYKPQAMEKSRKDSIISRVNKLGPKITQTVRGKLSLGAKMLQVGGLRKVYKQLFSVREGEKLLKASQCYLSTTAGPIAGLLFISTDKIAFCSDRSIKVSSPSGELLRFHYKVVIPVGKIERVHQSENVKKPSQKYLEIVTVDKFDFWFMGFLNYQKTFRFLQEALSQEWKNC